RLRRVPVGGLRGDDHPRRPRIGPWLGGRRGGAHGPERLPRGLPELPPVDLWRDPDRLDAVHAGRYRECRAAAPHTVGRPPTKFGVDLGFKAVNDGGGIHGRKVRTIWYDDGYKPQDAVANTRKLVEQDQVFAVIIPQGAPPVVATLEYLEQNRVPLLFPYQSSTVTRGRHWVFQGMTMSDRSSRMMIDYLVGRRKYR